MSPGEGDERGVHGADEAGERGFACGGLGRRGGERVGDKSLGALGDEDEKPACAR